MSSQATTRRGRPRKAEKRRPRTLRFGPSEWVWIVGQATHEGRDASDMIRDRCFSNRRAGPHVPVPDDEEPLERHAVRFSDAEWHQLDRRAGQRGETRNAYVRSRVLR